MVVALYRMVEVAQWRRELSSANREVGGSSLTVSTDEPLG